MQRLRKCFGIQDPGRTMLCLASLGSEAKLPFLLRARARERERKRTRDLKSSIIGHVHVYEHEHVHVGSSKVTAIVGFAALPLDQQETGAGAR